MPTYKFHYLDARGCGELLRYLFAYGDIPYEDIRIKKEKWPEVKPKTLFGNVPVMEIDDMKVAQSAAIGRYLANKVGLAGKNDLEKFEADSIVDQVADIKKMYSLMYKEQTEERKAARMKTLKEEQIPTNLKIFESMVKDSGWLVGSSMTWADIAVYELLENMIGHAGRGNKAFFEANCPKLIALRDRVAKDEKIAKYIEGRPHTDI